MSWKATAHVLQLADATTREELSATELLVLLALAGRHSTEWACAFGQQARVAIDTHLSEAQVSLTIGALEAKGLIRVWEGQLPRRKDSPTDGRRTRGQMWCFVGLDADDGPNIAAATPRQRRGGRPRGTPTEPPEPGSDEFRQDKPISADGFGEDKPTATEPPPASVSSGQTEFGRSVSGGEFRARVQPASGSRQREIEPVPDVSFSLPVVQPAVAHTRARGGAGPPPRAEPLPMTCDDDDAAALERLSYPERRRAG